MEVYKFNYKYIKGYPLYLVPKVTVGDTSGPRGAKNIGVTCFYPVNAPNHVVVAASKGANTYYSKRNYAKHIGYAEYSRNGFDHRNFVL